MTTNSLHSNRRERCVASVRNEGTDKATYFVYIEQEFSGSIYSCRFFNKDNADRVAREINRAFESEGRLLTRIFSEV